MTDHVNDDDRRPKGVVNLEGVLPQHNPLDDIIYLFFDFRARGTYLYSSPRNPLHVGRRNLPRCSRFSGFVHRCFPGVPKYKI